jgi:hypothetical protein
MTPTICTGVSSSVIDRLSACGSLASRVIQKP